jgi:hypothetical protein
MQNEESVYLPAEMQASLRSSGILAEHEVAIKMGDILIAKNVVTLTRRVLQLDALVESRRVLKG